MTAKSSVLDKQTDRRVGTRRRLLKTTKAN
jgi:hypothetical protein